MNPINDVNMERELVWDFEVYLGGWESWAEYRKEKGDGSWLGNSWMEWRI